MKLEKDEQALLTRFEKDELASIPNVQKEITRYSAYAKAHFQKNKRVNIRISQSDLASLQKLAAMEGLPYQTLMSSVLHRFVTGRLFGKSA